MTREGFKTLGTLVPTDIYNKFCAYARALNTTPSALLKQHVYDVLTGRRQPKTQHELLREISVATDNLRRSLTD